MKRLLSISFLLLVLPLRAWAQPTLTEDTLQLKNAVVYGKSRSQQLREGAFSVNAVDVAAVASQVTSVTHIVNRTSGIRVRTEGGLGSDFEVSLNGMSGNSVRYFIDGVPMNTKGSEVNLSNFPVGIIDHIEIYKGVVPAWLGADALGGAINIVTKRTRRNRLDASLAAGSFHTYIADLNAQYSLPKTGLLAKLTLGYDYAKNDYKVRDVELWDEAAGRYLLKTVRRFHDDYRSLYGELELSVEDKSWADLFSVSASWTDTGKELQTGSIQTKVYGMAERKQQAAGVSLRYRKKDLLVKGLTLNAHASQTFDHSVTIDTCFRKYQWDQTYIETVRNEITGYGRQIRHYRRPLTTVRANLDYPFSPRHSLNLNYMLTRTENRRYDDVDSDFEPTNDIMTKHVIGLSYTQNFFDGRMGNTFFFKDYINHVNIGQYDKYWITGADRIEHQATKNYTGYGAGMRYVWSEPLALKASYEHTARLPLTRELLGNGTTVYANLTLRPENSDNVNLGLFGTVRPGGGDHLFYYEAGGFYRHVKDFIHLVLSESEGLYQYANVTNVDVKGVEGEVRYSWREHLQLTGNLTFQDARDKNPLNALGKTSVTYNNKIPNRPWFYGNADATWNFYNLLGRGTRLRLNWQYQYVHWFYLTWEGYGARATKSRIPTQHVHTAAATWSWHESRYNLTLECSNLLDATLYDNYKLQKPGRAFLLKFRLLLN